MNRSPRSRTASTPRKGSPQTASLNSPEELWDEPVVAVASTRPDLELLQGAWICNSSQRQVAFFISGQRFTVHFARGRIYMGTFELNPTTQQRTMTVYIEEGEPHHKGQTALCLYELAGDVLRWCTAGPGSSEVLNGFPPENDSRYLHLVFRREHAES